MGTNKKSSWKETRTAERNRQLIMLAIPIVLILLIIIIVAADRSSKDETEPAVTETEASAGTEAPTETMENPDGTADNTDETPEETDGTEESAAEAPAPGVLQMDAVSEINQLMKNYYDARVSCDAEKLNGLYGKTETDAARLEAAKAQLFLYARHVSHVDEIVCYTAELENQNTWFVLMTAEIYFRSTDTFVPVGLDFFVRKNDEGNFLIVDPEEITEEMETFKQKLVRQDEAILLTRDINTKMRDAIDSDPVLTGIYGTLNSGSPLWDTGEPETEPEVEILTE